MPLIQSDILGTECWNVGIGPGGPNAGFMESNIVRNTEGLTTFTGASGATVTTLADINTATYMWTGTSPANWVVTTPTSPYSGQIIQIATDTTITTGVSVLASSGQTLSAAYSGQTLTGNGSVEFRYASAVTKWFRMR